MPSTQSLTCSLCGLRYANGRLLELHIRDDHVRRNHEAPSDRSTTSGSGTRQGAQEAHPAAPPSPPVARAAHGGRRAIRVLRHMNEELVRASEAIFRSARFPRPDPPQKAPIETDTHPGHDKTEHDSRAA